TRSVNTDLLPAKPNRRKRLALRFASFVVTVSAIGTAYWFTRPPELVWWRSESEGVIGPHLAVLIPQGWKSLPLHIERIQKKDDWQVGFEIRPDDQIPTILKWLG